VGCAAEEGLQGIWADEEDEDKDERMLFVGRFLEKNKKWDYSTQVELEYLTMITLVGWVISLLIFALSSYIRSHLKGEAWWKRAVLVLAETAFVVCSVVPGFYVESIRVLGQVAFGVLACLGFILGVMNVVERRKIEKGE